MEIEETEKAEIAWLSSLRAASVAKHLSADKRFVCEHILSDNMIRISREGTCLYIPANERISGEQLYLLFTGREM